MSKSLEFCVTTANNPERSGYCDRKWENAYERNSIDVFDIILLGERKLEVSGHDADGNDFCANVVLTFNPNADFQYFTSESCIHDGTLVHTISLLEKLAGKVCCLQTYYQPLGEPRTGMTVEIEVGNYVILDEFDEDGTMFAPKGKKWMRERTTALLPIRMEYK